MARKTSTTKRKYPYYKKSSSIVKRAKGNIAASKKQNDVADFTITFNHTFPVTSFTDASGTYSGYAMNIWDLLSKAPNFKAFQSMYDQVRINGVQIKLQTATSTVNTNNNNTIYNVYTAWDTDGMDKSLIEPVTDNIDIETGAADIVGYRTKLGSAIATYGSSSKMQLNPFQRWSQNRSLYPSNMQEKTQFVSTDSIVDYHKNFNYATKYFEFSDAYKSLGENTEQNKITGIFDEILNQDNPAILASNQKYPFKPTFYVDAFSSNVNNTTNLIDSYIPVPPDNKLVFSAEIRVPCTFRGLKGIADV